MLVETTTQLAATDLWGSAVPTWVSAIGTVAAAIIGVVALFRSNSAVGGVRVLRNGLRETAKDGEDGGSHAVTHDASDVTTEDETVERVAWSLDVDDRGKAKLISESQTDVELLEIMPSAGLDLTLHFPLPTNVPGGAPIRFVVHRILGGPAVRSITVRAKSKNGKTYTQVFYL